MKGKTAVKTICEVAQEMFNNMETKERSTGESFICNKEEINWQKDIIHKAHGESLPDDYIYQFINATLSQLIDSNVETEEQAHEVIDGLEPDVYTSDLTKWLNSSNNRVYYLTEALSDYGSKDGFTALRIAQQLEKQEVGHLVVDGIVDYINSI